MELSERGLRMLCSYEGFVGHVYLDGGGTPTIGYGHALTESEILSGKYHKVSMSREEAMELCKADVKRFEVAVSELVTVSISQSQFDALTDFAYNLGAGTLAKSTLLKRLNAGDYVGAASEFIRFDHIGKREDMGLKGRREGEARLFLEGTASVGGPTLDDVVRLAQSQQVDLQGLVDWEGRATRPTDPAPPDPIREADTNPELALPPKRPEEA